MKPLKYALVMQASDLKLLAKRYDAYEYLSVINNTDNTIQIFEGQVTAGDEKNTVVTIQPYTSLTVPIGNDQNYTFIYTDGGLAGVKKADVIFSAENLGYNSSLGPTVSGSIIITAEPATAADNAAGLPTVIKVVGGYDGANVQAIKTDAQGELQIDVLTEPATAADNAVGLPAVVKVVAGFDGANVQALLTNAAGALQVGVLVLPVVSLARDAGRTSTKVTAGGAGVQVVSAVAGKVWGIASATAAVTVELRDNAAGKWFVGAQQNTMFPVPIACLTNISLNFSGAGDAYIIWE